MSETLSDFKVWCVLQEVAGSCGVALQSTAALDLSLVRCEAPFFSDPSDVRLHLWSTQEKRQLSCGRGWGS